MDRLLPNASIDTGGALRRSPRDPATQRPPQPQRGYPEARVNGRLPFNEAYPQDSASELREEDAEVRKVEQTSTGTTWCEIDLAAPLPIWMERVAKA